MEPNPQKIPTCIGLDLELRDRLDSEAARQERSRSWVTAAAIRDYLDRQEAAAESAP